MEFILAPDTSKVNGPDNIPAKMLKSTAVSIALVLTNQVFKSFNYHWQATKCLETSSVVPIPKTENKSDARNYRLILLLSVTSKVWERHIQGKILMHLQSAYALSESHWEFCSGKSTIQALLTATNDGLEMMEPGIEAAAVFLTSPKHLTLCPTKL